MARKLVTPNLIISCMDEGKLYSYSELYRAIRSKHYISHPGLWKNLLRLKEQKLVMHYGTEKGYILTKNSEPHLAMLIVELLRQQAELYPQHKAEYVKASAIIEQFLIEKEIGKNVRIFDTSQVVKTRKGKIKNIST